MNETKALKKESLALMMNEAEGTHQTITADFTELYRRNATNVFYYLYSRVRNVADAEDLTSLTFVTALENLSGLRDPRKFTPWVFTIARKKSKIWWISLWRGFWISWACRTGSDGAGETGRSFRQRIEIRAWHLTFAGGAETGQQTFAALPVEELTDVRMIHLLDLGERPNRQHLAIGEHCDAIRCGGKAVEVMADHNDGEADVAVDLAEQSVKFGGGDGVESGGGFIEKEDFRLHSQRTGEGDPLDHSAR